MTKLPCVGCTGSSVLRKFFHSNAVYVPFKPFTCTVVNCCCSLLNKFNATLDVNLDAEA